MSYRAAYQADIVVDNKRVGCARYEGAIDTTGHGIACIVTGAIYGGWCWAYGGMPFNSHLAELRERARLRLEAEKLDQYQLLREDARKLAWSDGDGPEVFLVERNVQTCDTLRIQLPGN